MPNGGDLSLSEFRQLEDALLGIDSVLARFADEIGAKITRNYHDGPSRTLVRSGEVGLKRTISTGPVIWDFERGWVEDNYFYHISLMASKAIGGKTYWWHRTHGGYYQFPEERQLFELLRKGWDQLVRISEADLELAEKYSYP